MATTIDRRVPPQNLQTAAMGAPLPLTVWLNIVWNLVIIAVSIYGGLQILGMPGTFFDLGNPVQVAVGLIAFIPALLAAIGAVLLLMRRPGGRYISLILNYGGLILAGLALLHLWGVFIGFDAAARALLNNSQFLWGMPIAWAAYWLGGKIGDDSLVGKWMRRAGLLIAMLSLMLLLWFGNAAGGVLQILGTYTDGASAPGVWTATAVLLISASLGWTMLHLGRFFSETPAQQEAWQGWLMLSPNVVGFILFFAGPLLLSLYLSFTNKTVGGVPEVIGFRNYGQILSLQVRTTSDFAVNAEDLIDREYNSIADMNVFGNRVVIGAFDSVFWFSLRNTFLYCIMLIPLSMLPALLLALILNSTLPGMKFYRAIYFLPSVAAVVGTALIWRWMYDPVIGYINYGVTNAVTFMNSTFGTNIADPKIQWLVNEGVVLFSLVLMGGWQLIGFNTVLFLAGLQGIPKLLYEASYVDGANTWERFRYITFPLLAPTTFFVAITTIITGLQVFNEPYALIFQRPMPLNATTAVYYMYNRGFFYFEFGYASAVAWVLFVVIFIVTLIQFRLQNRGQYDY